MKQGERELQWTVAEIAKIRARPVPPTVLNRIPQKAGMEKLTPFNEALKGVRASMPNVEITFGLLQFGFVFGIAGRKDGRRQAVQMPVVVSGKVRSGDLEASLTALKAYFAAE